jgi:hypothetical protein
MSGTLCKFSPAHCPASSPEPNLAENAKNQLRKIVLVKEENGVKWSGNVVQKWKFCAERLLFLMLTRITGENCLNP